MGSSKDSKVPAPVQNIRKYLEEKGLACTADNLKLVPSATRNAAASSMRTALAPTAMAEYKKSKSDAERRQWLQQFILDPACCAREGLNKTKLATLKMNDENVVWVTLEQLAGSSFLNNMEHAKATIATLNSRPHEIAALAAEGILQYEYTSSVTTHKKIKETSTETRAKVELTDNQYGEVTADLTAAEDDGKKGVKRKAQQKERPVLSAEEKSRMPRP